MKIFCIDGGGGGGRGGGVIFHDLPSKIDVITYILSLKSSKNIVVSGIDKKGGI